MGKIELCGINVRDVINKHYSNGSDDSITNVTKSNLVLINSVGEISLSDLLHEDNKIGIEPLFFFDSKKRRIKIWPIMIDQKQKTLPLFTNKPCRFCHHSYNTHPIGCPIKYHHLKETGSDDFKKINRFLKENNLSTETNDFFETEHMFCSWPCVKAYIFLCLSQNPHSHRYKNSLSYLSLMYKKIMGSVTPPKIPTAGPIELIDTYGGHLTIEEYRLSFGILDYEMTINSNCPSVFRPYMFPSSKQIEERRCH